MVLPTNFWLLFLAAMVISSIGFKNYVWFISLGYGFSIAGEGLLLMLLYGKELTLGTIICCILFIVYGCRLGGYLAIREMKSSSYKDADVNEVINHAYNVLLYLYENTREVPEKRKGSCSCHSPDCWVRLYGYSDRCIPDILPE